MQIEIITRVERNQALMSINNAIRNCGGWIVDHKLFSNMSASITFEMPQQSASSLIARLEDDGFRPKTEGERPVGTTREVRGSIAITFVHDEPDMKRDVPAFD